MVLYDECQREQISAVHACTQVIIYANAAMASFQCCDNMAEFPLHVCTVKPL